ncbi:hypothetical protein Scep_030072 [Stephania cephalantha]|uniref:Uncharacterized protein n=1 Tax=Stephania cephalantha TaxID=152367 RepID=A0AAP0DZ40_9MAGN
MAKGARVVFFCNLAELHNRDVVVAVVEVLVKHLQWGPRTCCAVVEVLLKHLQAVARMSSLGTSKGILEIVKFSLYVCMPIGLMYTFTRNPDKLLKTMGQNYIEYPPEAPRPPSLEELQEMA